MNKQMLVGFVVGVGVITLLVLVIWKGWTMKQGLGREEAVVVQEGDRKDDMPFDKSLDVKIGGPVKQKQVQPGTPKGATVSPDMRSN